MTPFHLNYGRKFKQPYESAYAMLRRCLVANPGIPYNSIAENLRALYPRHRSIYERLAQYQDAPEIANIPDLPVFRHIHRRQCPQCAQLLYHSLTFCLPWVTHCPLHHCELTFHCPACLRPWPEPANIQKRNCPVCGVPPVQQLGEVVLSGISEQNFQPIADIHALVDGWIEQTSTKMCVVLNHEVGESFWPRRVQLDEPAFASFEAHRTHRITPEHLKKLGLPTYEISRTTSKISEIDREALETERWMHKIRTPREEWELPNSRKLAIRHLSIHCVVMRRIVKWIFSHTSHPHHITIASYRYLELENILSHPDPCPYCFAFSLWFYNSMAEFYGPFVARKVDNYPFILSRCLHYAVLASDKPQLFVENRESLSETGVYQLDPTFNDWFYRRGLEISFADSLRLAFRLRRTISEYRKHDTSIEFSAITREDAPERLYWADVTNGELHFDYVAGEPLDYVSLTSIDGLSTQCDTYQRYLRGNHRDGSPVTFEPIIEPDLTVATFREMRERFAAFLHRLFNY